MLQQVGETLLEDEFRKATGAEVALWKQPEDIQNSLNEVEISEQNDKSLKILFG